MHERRPDLTEAEGGAIVLAENLLLALDSLGATEDAIRDGDAKRSFSYADAQGRAHTPSRSNLSSGGRYYYVSRAGLHHALLNAALRAGATVVPASGVRSASPDGTVVFENGDQARAELVVGADGVGSSIRRSLGSNGGTHGRAGIRVRVRPLAHYGVITLLDQLLPETEQGHMTERWNGSLRIGYGWLGDGTSGVLPVLRADGLSADRHALDLDRWMKAFPDQSETIRAVAASRPKVSSLSEVVCSSWSDGRVAGLLGDAAHAMPPHSADRARQWPCWTASTSGRCAAAANCSVPNPGCRPCSPSGSWRFARWSDLRLPLRAAHPIRPAFPRRHLPEVDAVQRRHRRALSGYSGIGVRRGRRARDPKPSTMTSRPPRRRTTPSTGHGHGADHRLLIPEKPCTQRSRSRKWRSALRPFGAAGQVDAESRPPASRSRSEGCRSTLRHVTLLGLGQQVVQQGDHPVMSQRPDPRPDARAPVGAPVGCPGSAESRSRPRRPRRPARPWPGRRSRTPPCRPGWPSGRRMPGPPWPRRAAPRSAARDAIRRGTRSSTGRRRGCCATGCGPCPGRPRTRTSVSRRRL